MGAAIIACAFCACGNDNASESATPDSAVSETETVKIESFMIETPYGMMKLPADWTDKVKVDTKNEKDIFTVNVSSSGVQLFSIIINGKDGEPLGTLTSNDKKVEYRYVMTELDKNAANYTQLAELQGGLEYITENLVKDYGFVKAK